MGTPSNYQFARDRLDWDGTILALEPDIDGNLQLAQLPGPADGAPIDLPAPWTSTPSGIAAGPCDAVFVADTAENRILYVDGACVAKAWLPATTTAGSAPGQFNGPEGLAVAADGLWVADTGNGRVQRFAFPELALDNQLDGLSQPTGLAVDSAGQVYVLDRGTKRVRRFTAQGFADPAYDAALAGAGKLVAPLFLAVDAQDRLLVTDASTKTMRVFDGTAALLRDVAPPGAWQPGAIAAGTGRLFVADQASGRIEVFQPNGDWWCSLAGFRGPVTALAVDPSGNLLIKTAQDATYLVFPAGQAFASEGSVTVGPYDAGERQQWFRAACDATAPRGTSLRLDVAQADAPTPAPSGTDWVQAPAMDALLASLLPPGPAPASRRHLWLRLTVATLNPALSPLIRNLRAETPGEDYRDYLPETYRRHDNPSLFLYRLLCLAGTELAAVEERIDALAWLLSPDFVPASELPWLAEWLALDLPRDAPPDDRRKLIARAVALYRRRGTPSGICDFVEIYTGLRPSIIEAFTERPIWVLDVASRLGFDTGLPANDPLGMVVPDPQNPLAGAAGCCATTVGSAVVGQSGPLPVTALGEPLFLDTAHRFTVFLPAYRAADAGLRSEVRRIIDAEKPAHTDYHLCLIEAEMRVGFQAQVGIDTIVAGPPTPIRLDGVRLGLDTNLPDTSGGGRIGEAARVGTTTVLG